VIYVSIPEKMVKESVKPRSLKNGSITFSYGQNLNRGNRYDSFTDIVNSYTSPTTQVSHVPNVGDMFIFPSYLQHYVLPFFSEGVERISVAGNIRLISSEKKIL
jgi:urocanate hydratase